MDDAEFSMRAHDPYDRIESQLNTALDESLHHTGPGVLYDIKLGDCLWHIYRMIGRLSSRVYLLSAPG